jgi:hypothetical protein
MTRALGVWLSGAAAAAASLAIATAAPAPTSNILLAAEVPVVPMAEWDVDQGGRAEQTGARILIAAGEADLARAPPTASRYTSQTFRFKP